MRILTKYLWRAFPELDRFSDDQCARFVHSANSRRLARIITWSITLFASALAAAIAIIGPIWARPSYNRPRAFPTYEDIFEHVFLGKLWFWVLWMTAAMLAGFVTRDILLRVRIRRLLRVRSVCMQCRYSLLGLTVPSDLIVHCPECGTPTQVDASLGELTVDDAGVARFTPREITRTPRFFTPKRVRIIKRIALILGIGVPVLTGLSLGGYEFFLRWQAGHAAKDRVPASYFNNIVTNRQPADPSEANAYTFIFQLEGQRGAAELALNKKHPPPTVDGRVVDWVDIASVYYAFDPGYEPTPFDLASQRRAVQQFGEYEQSPLRDTLDAIAEARNAQRFFDYLPQDPAVNILLPELGQMRHMTRYCAARMHVARNAGDTREWLRAFRASLALSRAASMQITGIEYFVACSIEVVTFQQLVQLLQSHPDAATLDAIEAILEQQRMLPLSQRLDTMHAIDRDLAAWIFADPSRVRWGRFSPQVQLIMSVDDDKVAHLRMATYAQNRDAIDDIYSRLADLLKQPAHRQLQETFASDLIVPQSIVVPVAPRYLQAEASRLAYRDAITIMLALERHYLATGAYPASLDELTPGYLKSLPIDSWSPTGAPLRYLKVDPAHDMHCREYLVYSIGADGTDNAGIMPPGYPDGSILVTPRSPPVDFVFNSGGR